MLRTRFFHHASSGALAALLLTGTAYAQSAPAPAAANENGIADIIVTAERHSTTIQKTPLTIVAVPGDQLVRSGVTKAADLQQLVPGLDMRQNTGAGVAIYIRGVGADNRTIGSDPSNVFTLDGIALNGRNGPDAVFYDVDRVEVLKGPQGTLYGRNSVGGAINLLTHEPKLGELSGYAIAGYGNYDALKLEGALNIPLGDKVALRIAGNRVKHDGYLDKGTFTQLGEPSKHPEDQNVTAGRVKLLLEPSDSFKLILNADYSQARGRGPGYVVHGPTNNLDGTTPDPNNLTSAYIGGVARLDPCSDQVRSFVFSVTENPVQVGAGCTGFLHNKSYAFGGNAEADLGFAKWTTLANYRHGNDNYRYFFRWDSIRTIGAVTEKTVESRLSSQGGSPLSWVGGIFYFKESGRQIDWAEINTALYTYADKPINHSESLGLFGQATYAVTDSFRLTGGLRYSRDKKAFSNLTQAVVPAELLKSNVTFSAANAATFKKVNYRAVAEYDVTPANMVYASLSTGYHAGGLAPGETTGPYISQYDPETLTAYAVGTKNRFADNKVQLNAELFYWKYGNILYTTRGYVNCSTCVATPGNPPTPAGAVIALVTYNAGKAYIYGIDVDARWQVTPTTQLNGSMYWNKSEYQNLLLTPLPVNQVNATGNRIANAPAWQATGGIEQRIPLGDAGDLRAAANWRYLGPVWLRAAHNVAGGHVDGRHNVDLTLTYTTANDMFSLTGYVRNVFNAANVLNSASDREPATGAQWVQISPPRLFGLQAQIKF